MEQTNTNNLSGSYPEPNSTPNITPEPQPSIPQNPAESQPFTSQSLTEPQLSALQAPPKFQSQTDYHTDINQPTNTPKTTKPVVIAIAIITLIGVIGALIYFLIPGIRPSSKTGNDNDSDGSQQTAFDDLTKEEAITFLKNQASSASSVPNNYVKDEIKNAAMSTNGLRLIYSYDTLNNLEQQVIEEYAEYNLLLPDPDKRIEYNDFKITEYDYYAIVTPNDTSQCDYFYYQHCNSLLSFKREYIDYAADPPNVNYTLNTRDPEIANYLLRVLNYCGIFDSSHRNIYNYTFENQDDEYILTVNTISIGINLESYDSLSKGASDPNNASSDMFAMNLYRQRLAANKTDGNIHAITTENGIMDLVKSIPITEKEFSELLTILTQNPNL